MDLSTSDKLPKILKVPKPSTLYFDLYGEHKKSEFFEFKNGLLTNLFAEHTSGVGIRKIENQKETYHFVEGLNEQAILQSTNKLHIPGNHSEVITSLLKCDMNTHISVLKTTQSIASYCYQYITKYITSSISLTTHIEVISKISRIYNCHQQQGGSIQNFIIVKCFMMPSLKKKQLLQHACVLPMTPINNQTYAQLKQLCKTLIDINTCATEGKNIPNGSYDLVLAGGDAGILFHEIIGHPLELDAVNHGQGVFSDKYNQRVGNKLCTIIDDGLQPLPGLTGKYDDELTPKKRNILVENGTVKNYLSSRHSIAQTNYTLSGNGRRESFRTPPLPRMTTTYLAPRHHDPEEIIASVNKGVYCNGFYSGKVNITNGQFIFYPSKSYLIEKGKIIGPVHNLAVHSNALEVLQKISMVGNDLQFSNSYWQCSKKQKVQVGIGSPTVKLTNINIGGS